MLSKRTASAVSVCRAVSKSRGKGRAKLWLFFKAGETAVLCIHMKTKAC